MKKLRMPFRRVNLSRATLKPVDLENFRIRESMVQHQNNEAQRTELIAVVLRETHEDYKRGLLKTYGLRPGKKYDFDLATGKITPHKKPVKVKKTKPKDETPEPSANGNGQGEKVEKAPQDNPDQGQEILDPVAVNIAEAANRDPAGEIKDAE